MRITYVPVLILLVATLCSQPRASGAAASPQATGPQADQEESFTVIKAGRLITLAGSEPASAKGASAEVVLVDGKIRLVGADLEYPKSARVIDARREVVMPGLILPQTRWQLPSYSRSGVHGDRSAAREIYLGEIDFQPLLEAGFTAACFDTAGSGIPGPSAVFRTAGKKEDRDLGAAYLRITMYSPGSHKKVLGGAVDKARKEIEKVEKARKAWEEKQKKAKEEAAKKKPADPADKPDPKKKIEPGPDKKQDKKEGGKETSEKKEEAKDKPAASTKKEPEKFVPPKIDPAVKPLVDWIRDKKGPALLFELGRASDLRHLEDVLKPSPEIPHKLYCLRASSSSDFHRVVADLGGRKAIVLLRPQISRLPYTATRYNLPGELAAAGCTVVLLPRADAASELKATRTRLAELVRAGLSRQDALKAVTLNAARLLGLQDRLGTVEKGKDADLIFLDGDPLAAETRVTRVMIAGEIVWEAPKRP